MSRAILALFAFFLQMETNPQTLIMCFLQKNSAKTTTYSGGRNEDHNIFRPRFILFDKNTTSNKFAITR